MARIRLIFAPTVQHTGTWFTLRMLEASPDVTGVILWRELRETGYKLPKAGAWILHTHLGNEHCDEPEQRIKGCVQTDGELELWFRAFPSIVPIRDPLAALVTRQARAPELVHTHIVEGFRRLAATPATPFYFPIDIYRNSDVRFKLAGELFGVLGLRMCPIERIRRWRPENSVGSNDLKRAYAAGDLDRLQSAFPKSFAYLMEHRNVIQPFLERIGYRGLAWFA